MKLIRSHGGERNWGEADRPSPQSPKGILGSPPPTSLKNCNLLATPNSLVFNTFHSIPK
jgi:hypothetical protein